MQPEHMQATRTQTQGMGSNGGCSRALKGNEESVNDQIPGRHTPFTCAALGASEQNHATAVYGAVNKM